MKLIKENINIVKKFSEEFLMVLQTKFRGTKTYNS